MFVEAIFLFGVFPYIAAMLRTEGVTSASIAGVVIAGFAVGGIIYTVSVSRLLMHIGERRLMATGGMAMAFCLIVIALRMPWPVEFANFMLLGFGFYLLHGCHPDLCHRTCARRARLGDRRCIRSSFLSGRRWGRLSMASACTAWGSAPVLLLGAAVLTATGWVCALGLRRPQPGPI